MAVKCSTHPFKKKDMLCVNNHFHKIYKLKTKSKMGRHSEVRLLVQ